MQKVMVRTRIGVSVGGPRFCSQLGGSPLRVFFPLPSFFLLQRRPLTPEADNQTTRTHRVCNSHHGRHGRVCGGGCGGSGSGACCV